MKKKREEKREREREREGEGLPPPCDEGLALCRKVSRTTAGRVACVVASDLN